jgi:hypothetical protein
MNTKRTTVWNTATFRPRPGSLAAFPSPGALRASIAILDITGPQPVAMTRLE